MNDKIESLRSRFFDHQSFRGIINKSVNFWRNDLKLPKPCCITEHDDFEENSKKTEPSTEQSGSAKNKGKLSFKELFKTIKPPNNEGLPEIFKTRRVRTNQKKTNSRKKKEKLKYNDWTPEEDILLMKLCNSQMHKKWKKIAIIIGDKTPRKCAYRIKKLERHMHNFELMKSKLHICGEQDLLEEYKLQLGRLSKEPQKKKKKMRKLRRNRLQFNDDFALTLNQLTNLQLVEKKPLEKAEVERISRNNSERLTTDYEMKNYNSNNTSSSQNDSMERSRSRRNSGDGQNLVSKDNNDKYKFEKAFKKIFSYQENENLMNEIDTKNLVMQGEIEESKREESSEPWDDFFTSEIVNTSPCQQYKFIPEEVDMIYKSTLEDSEEKVLRLTNYLMDLNFKSRETDSIDEKRNYMTIQAKILECLIDLTRKRDGC